MSWRHIRDKLYQSVGLSLVLIRLAVKESCFFVLVVFLSFFLSFFLVLLSLKVVIYGHCLKHGGPFSLAVPQALG